MKKILFLTNCQGFEYNNFLRSGSDSYARDWECLKSIQAQSMKASDAPFLLEQMEEADVIVAQPLFSAPIKEIHPSAIRSWADRVGKKLISIPALQYDALTFGTVPKLWRDVPKYPFAANENMLIAAGYTCGLSAKATAELYHNATLLNEQQLRERVDFGISAFQKREMEAGADIIASEYYAKHWRTSRLHFAKGHPLPEVMRHFAGALAEKLGIQDFDPLRTGAIKGFFGHCMPIPRWIKNGLDLEFETDHDTVCCDKKYMSLEEFIKIMFEWYDVQGRDEVERRVSHEMPYKRAVKAAAQLAGAPPSKIYALKSTVLGRLSHHWKKSRFR
jgi:hypothetical protein